MAGENRISRRNFLKVASAQLAASLLPIKSLDRPTNQQRATLKLALGELPLQLRRILSLVPDIRIGDDGYVYQNNPENNDEIRLNAVQTQWNRERSGDHERLFGDMPWGIVLHWFGITFDGNERLAGYLRGFDGYRDLAGYQIRTSAHFLIGDQPSAARQEVHPEGIGIVQTQFPASDGTPLAASHLFTLDYESYRDRRQYFVRAWEQIEYAYPEFHSILIDFYTQPNFNPNYRTIAIELTGSAFEKEENFPGRQQLANTIAIICALMKRYHIPITNILGHHEIELRKPDPGKHFLSVVRFLVGIQALISDDIELQDLVFGVLRHTRAADSWDAVSNYFSIIRESEVLLAFPDQVYLWESKVNYWVVWDKIQKKRKAAKSVKFIRNMRVPFAEPSALKGDHFLEPANFPGDDMFLRDNSSPYDLMDPVRVLLAGDGECVHISENKSGSSNGVAIFRHYQPDGAVVLTLYGHLSRIADLVPGHFYRQGNHIGAFDRGGEFGEGYLFFAIAYGAAWESLLRNSPGIPVGLKANKILRYFIKPQDYLVRWRSQPPSDLDDQVKGSAGWY